MKRFILYASVVGCCVAAAPDALGQSWNASQNCHINARTDDSRFGGRADVIDATFKWRITRLDGTVVTCTGVLMNRRVDQDDLGYYFSTARHCLHYSDFDLGAPDIDLNADHYFMFHYESPSATTGQTPPSNQGQSLHSSNSLTPSLPQNMGYEYLHVSKVQLIKESITGDYALLRIVTPPPPHFNLYFAGWHPSSSGIPANGTLINPCGQWHAYVLPNHPRGDIKKINGAAALQSITTPTYVVCNWVTTVIDFLFGWIWGNTTSTQLICSYVDVPWYTVEWCDHGIESGSSGAPLFSPSGQYAGPLSGMGNPCSGWVPTSIGKFKNVYPFSAIKNTLNPSHDLGTDWYGIGGRRISCYTNLSLPGGHLQQQGQTTYYFPASHYQPENRITLRAQQHINVVAPITILEGAHYEFKAGNSITLDGLVEVHPGATFVAEIEGCSKSAGPSGGGMALPQFTKLPKSMSLVKDLPVQSREGQETDPYVTAHPNPGSSTIALRSDMGLPWHAELITTDGRMMFNGPVTDMQLDLSGIANGMYLLRLHGSRGDIRMTRIVVQ
jgi:hypothetical protein